MSYVLMLWQWEISLVLYLIGFHLIFKLKCSQNLLTSSVWKQTAAKGHIIGVYKHYKCYYNAHSVYWNTCTQCTTFFILHIMLIIWLTALEMCNCCPAPVYFILFYFFGKRDFQEFWISDAWPLNKAEKCCWKIAPKPSLNSSNNDSTWFPCCSYFCSKLTVIP